MQGYSITNIATQTTTHIAAIGQAVIVHSVVLPVTNAGTITFQSLAATPVVYFVLPASTLAQTMVLDVVCGNGLDVVTASGDKVMVITGI